MDKNRIRIELKGYSWIYIIMAGLTLILIAVNYMFPDVSESICKRIYNTTKPHGFKATTMLTIGYIFECSIYLLFFLLLRRIIKKKSNGIILGVLLIINIILNSINLFINIDISVLLGLIVDIYILGIISKLNSTIIHKIHLHN